MPNVVLVCEAIRRFSSFRIASISQFAVTMNGMVAAPLQFIADRSFAGAGKAFNQIVSNAHLLEDNTQYVRRDAVSHGYWSGLPRPEATPGSGILPACPLITATGGWLSPPEHSPATGATPTLLRIVVARLTARSCAAGPRASRSQSGNDRSRRCGGGSGLARRVCFPRAIAPPCVCFSPVDRFHLWQGSTPNRTLSSNSTRKSRGKEPRTRAADTSCGHELRTRATHNASTSIDSIRR